MHLSVEERNMCKLFARSFILIAVLVVLFTYDTAYVFAQPMQIATTSVQIGICGNGIVEPGQDCDVPGETGEYSTTIAGRQCTPDCTWGPYCGDGILQTQFGEECDDGTNTDDGFCSADCRLIPAGAGGGGGGGGGGSSRPGGSDVELGPTQVNIAGRAYPNSTVNIILDTENIGTVQTNSSGDFDFLTGASPGTATLGVWAEDGQGTRSVTFNTTFDVTQGAITNVNNVLLPPTLRLSAQEVDPGATVTVSGQSIPNATIEVHIQPSGLILETESGSNGNWELELDTTQISIAEHTVRARTVTGTGALTTDSAFSRSLQLFVGVDGQPSSNADLNRDGRVDLIDFSILIFWWGTDGGNSDPPADINQDGIVNLADFSILLFNWTG